MRVGCGRAALAGAWIAAWASGCANQGAPLGGPTDRRPPVVVRTEPDTFAVVSDLRTSVRFHFDERISERIVGGTLDDAVTVSPRTGDVRVRHGSRTLTVEVGGGLRPGVVYRVTLLPVVHDLFGNRLTDPFELVFSTGGALLPTALAGWAWNRITGEGVGGARVHARGPDSLVHVAQADGDGIFAFRYLPGGSFLVTGFEDLDRDDVVDAHEPQGSVAANLGAADTLILNVPLLPQDTTPAVLAGARALDSLTVVLEFDDYIDPEAPSSDVVVLVETDGAATPAVGSVLHEHEYEAYVTAVRDSLAAAAGASLAAPSSPAVRPDSAADVGAVSPGAAQAGLQSGPRAFPSLAGGAGGGGRARTGPDGRPLPSRRMVVRLRGPLEPEREYGVRAGGVVNVNGLGGGGGQSALRLEPSAASRGPEPLPNPGNGSP